MPPKLAAALPYALPYLAFLLVLEAARVLPAAWAGVLLALQVALPGLLLLGYGLQGAYPELRGPCAGPRAWLRDAALGLAIAGLWTAPYLWLDGMPEPPAEGAFDPRVLGASHALLAWVVRGLGFAVVTPFVEELFVRSLLWRWIAAGREGDLRHVPVGARSRRAAVGTTLLFAAAHMPWEWPVALPTGALFAAWLWWLRDLRACVRAHAMANAALLLLAWARPETFAVFL